MAVASPTLDRYLAREVFAAVGLVLLAIISVIRGPTPIDPGAETPGRGKQD